MATGQSTGRTSYDLASPETAIHWSGQLMIQLTNDQHELLNPKSGLIGEGQRYAICHDKGLTANNGGTVHKTLMFSLQHLGVDGDTGKMRGNEGSFDDASFEYKIGSWRGGWEVDHPLTEQFVAFDVLDNYTQNITEWCWRRDYLIMLAYLTGYTADAGSGWTDHTGLQVDVSLTNRWTRKNAVRAPCTDYSYKGTKANSRTNDEDVVAGDELDLPTIYHLARLVRTAKFPLRPPIKCNGRDALPWLIGPKTFATMQVDADITEIWHSAMQGGYIEKNPLISNSAGYIWPFVFFVVDDMPPGVHSSTNAAVTSVERSVILGCNALSMTFPKGWNPGNRWKYITGTDDGGWEKWMHVAGAGGWATTFYLDPTNSNAEIQFKFVCTHYTGA